MKAGAADFVEKPFDDEVLLSAVQAPLHASLAGREQDAEIAVMFQCLRSLSPRVPEGVISDKANKVIAVDLGISPRTVEIYRANLMEKMKAATLSDLVRKAMLADVIPEGSDAVAGDSR